MSVLECCCLRSPRPVYGQGTQPGHRQAWAPPGIRKRSAGGQELYIATGMPTHSEDHMRSIVGTVIRT